MDNIEVVTTTSKKRNATESMDDAPIDEIKSIVQEIVSSTGNVKDKEREFQTKYSYFAERYPMLFKMACKPDFDMNRLNQIFGMMERVNKNEITYDNATKQFGQDMFNTYIKPNLDKMKQKK